MRCVWGLCSLALIEFLFTIMFLTGMLFGLTHIFACLWASQGFNELDKGCLSTAFPRPFTAVPWPFTGRSLPFTAFHWPFTAFHWPCTAFP